MASKTFLTISKKECSTVYKNILDNSDKKWESGKKLADTGEYGGATSLAIISIEELVKGLIVFIDGQGFDFRRVKGMKSIFENHQIRYLIAFSMFVMGLAGEELVKLVQSFKGRPQELTTLMNKIKTDKEFLRTTGTRYVLKKLVVLKNEFDWFSRVDIFRQDGFYCDYDEQLKNPISITEEDYRHVISRLEKVRLVGKALIDSFDTKDEVYLEHIRKMKRDFKAKRFYDKIGESLATVRQSRESPFDLIKNSMKKK